MLDLVEDNKTGIFELVVRGVYLTSVVALDAGILYVVIYPGFGREQMFERGMIGMLLLISSVVIAIPSFLYCLWKLFNGERPSFWLTAFLIAILPTLYMFAKFIFDIVRT